MNTKKKILFVTEASYVLSGFGNYFREVIGRLHATGKYEIAEFASYGKISDPRAANIPWRFYPNEPEEGDPSNNEYRGNPFNVFGKWRFERVVVDFKPDVVCLARDVWMDQYVQQSPLRPYFHLVWMPTHDSSPGEEDWIESYTDADAVFTYSDWCLDDLKKQSGGRMNVLGSASPGVDPKIFKPAPNKQQHRANFGIMPDIFLVGTVMRNQKRKLFPDLFHAFRMYLDKAPEHIARKSFLYIHTSYPDVGWKLPKLITEQGLNSKILSSYICRSCRRAFANFFQDARAVCLHCKQPTAVLPSVGDGFTVEQMAQMYQCMDMYVQYAITEGCGIGQVEAAMCGVPLASVDHSAMADIVRKVEGYPIRVQTKFRELETHAYRAYPDNNHLTEILLKFFQLPEAMRARKGFNTRNLAVRHYDWDQTSKKWEDYLDSYSPKGTQGRWDSPPRLWEPNMNIPPNLPNKEFINWAYANILGEPDKAFGLTGQTMLRDLNFGASVGNGGVQPFGRDHVLNFLKATVDFKNAAEKARLGMIPLNTPDYIVRGNQ
jgi:glycosyltransferase involved in cell wall biosynthesis